MQVRTYQFFLGNAFFKYYGIEVTFLFIFTGLCRVTIHKCFHKFQGVIHCMNVLLLRSL